MSSSSVYTLRVVLLAAAAACWAARKDWMLVVEEGKKVERVAEVGCWGVDMVVVDVWDGGLQRGFDFR